MNHHDPLVRPATWAVDGMWWVYSTCVFQHGEVMIWTCRKTPGWSCGGQGGLSFTKKNQTAVKSRVVTKKNMYNKNPYKLLGGGFKHFYVHPYLYLGKWSNLTNIFSNGLKLWLLSESWQLQHKTKVDDVYARRLRNLCMRRCHLLREQPKAPLRRAQWWRYWDATVIKWATGKKPGWLGYIGDYTTQFYRGYNKPL